MTTHRRENRCHNRTVTVIDEAGVALVRGDWRRALEILGDDSSDDALQLRAAACYGAGDLEACVTAWEDLHRNRRGSGDLSGAAWAAGMVALHLMIDTGLMSPVRGWIRRAGTLLVGLPNDRAQAIVAMVSTYERFMSGDPEESRVQAKLAIDLGELLEVRAAVVVGRTALGRLMIIAGDVDAGLTVLDDVAAELMSGDVDALTTGMMYCELICAAQGLGEHDLARQWTDLMERWRHGSAMGGMHGRCRVHRAELLRLSGPAEAAEQEALGACEELRPWLRRELGWPLVELGNIRRLRGDFEGAEAAYVEAHQLVWSPQPGLALLRLEQGHLAVAAALISDALDHPEANPSKEQPPFGDLRRAPLLAAQAEIAAANADPATTRCAADALVEIADRYSTNALHAEAHVACARAALLEGAAAEAIESSAAAIEAWGRIGAPFGTAVARMLSGCAHELAGNRSRAELDWTAARRDFEEFGAPRWVAAVSRLLERAQPGGAATQPDRTSLDHRDAERITFARVGECRRIAWRSVEVLIPDLKGFRYLHYLLLRAGDEVHVLDLIATEFPLLAVRPFDPDLRAGARLGLPVLDGRARDAYRRRLAEVDEEIDDATANHDLGRLALAEHDRDHLVTELARAFGLSGRPRTTGGDVERARSSITRTLRYCLKRLGEVYPELGAHLDRHVRTGTYCSYQPDPINPVAWDLS